MASAKNEFSSLTMIPPFSYEDRAIIMSYKAVVEMISNLLAGHAEVVLHSLENLEKSVVCIANGELTGRKIGSPITNKALSLLFHMEESKRSTTAVYFSKSHCGRVLRSSTLVIRGVTGNPIGLLCVNLNLSAPFVEFLSGLLPPLGEEVAHHFDEFFASSVEELFGKTVNKIKEEVMGDKSIMNSNKNKEIVINLYREGLFEIKNAPVLVADILNISKHTVYMHLRNYKKDSCS